MISDSELPDFSEFEERSRELTRGLATKTIRSRGLVIDLGEQAASIAEPVFHWVPYVLATIYYACSVGRMIGAVGKDKLKIVFASWIKAAADRVHKLGGGLDIDREALKDELLKAARKLTREIGDGDPKRAEPLLVNEFFDVFKRYNPKASERERGVIEFVVHAELDRLHRRG